jgi:uncharacterized protein
MTRDECLSRLPTVSVGRLGVTLRALPAIIPVNFAMDDDLVVIRSVPGSKLEAATSGMVVAFEADDHAPDGSWGWSVLVQGIAEQVTDPDELAALRTLHVNAWAFPAGEADTFLRIPTEVVSGRRFEHSAAFRP